MKPSEHHIYLEFHYNVVLQHMDDGKFGAEALPLHGQGQLGTTTEKLN